MVTNLLYCVFYKHFLHSCGYRRYPCFRVKEICVVALPCFHGARTYQYLELAKTQRSGCCNVECKNNGEKIPKNTLRHGTMVTIQEHQTWKWRHW